METDCKQLTDKLLKVRKPSGNASSGFRPNDLNSVQSLSNEINGHECVDLGLSVKWATCNLGASSPEGFGDFFAWGETAVKEGTVNYNGNSIFFRMQRISSDDDKYRSYYWTSSLGHNFGGSFGSNPYYADLIKSDRGIFQKTKNRDLSRYEKMSIRPVKY